MHLIKRCQDVYTAIEPSQRTFEKEKLTKHWIIQVQSFLYLFDQVLCNYFVFRKLKINLKDKI